MDVASGVGLHLDRIRTLGLAALPLRLVDLQSGDWLVLVSLGDLRDLVTGRRAMVPRQRSGRLVTALERFGRRLHRAQRLRGDCT
jgi:hypothetical protein